MLRAYKYENFHLVQYPPLKKRILEDIPVTWLLDTGRDMKTFEFEGVPFMKYGIDTLVANVKPSDRVCCFDTETYELEGKDLKKELEALPFDQKTDMLQALGNVPKEPHHLIIMTNCCDFDFCMFYERCRNADKINTIMADFVSVTTIGMGSVSTYMLRTLMKVHTTSLAFMTDPTGIQNLLEKIKVHYQTIVNKEKVNLIFRESEIMASLPRFSDRPSFLGFHGPEDTKVNGELVTETTQYIDREEVADALLHNALCHSATVSFKAILVKIFEDDTENEKFKTTVGYLNRIRRGCSDMVITIQNELFGVEYTDKYPEQDDTSTQEVFTQVPQDHSDDASNGSGASSPILTIPPVSLPFEQD